jgi:hypothetical protein
MKVTQMMRHGRRRRFGLHPGACLLACLLASLLSGPHPVRGQAGEPDFPPAARTVAELIGATPLVEDYYRLSEADRGLASDPPSREALFLRQQIIELVLSSMLETDGTIAEIDYEIDRLTEVRAYLEVRRDRNLMIGGVAMIVTSAVSGVASAAIELTEGSTTLDAAINLAGGAISATLSVLGLREQLAPFLATGPAAEPAQYPAALWQYFNSPVPTEAARGVRRERLIRQWTEAGLIAPERKTKDQRYYELLAASDTSGERLTISLVNTRIAMLAGVRVWAERMKRDLSQFMVAFRTHARRPVPPANVN